MELTYKSGAPEALWTPALQPVYLFYGEEDGLKQEALAALKRHVVAADFDLEELDAGATADAILAAAGQIPFGSERRLVVVTGLEQWRERGRQAEADRLAEGLERLSDSACLALVAWAGEEEARRKTAVTSKLDAAAKKLGALVACKALRGEALMDWVRERARQEGKRMDAAAAEQLVQMIGGEIRPLEQEIRKLACYVGEGETIQAQDVAVVTASSPEDVMFAAVEAITRRQTDKALTLLAELHRYDPKPQAVAGKLLALLARQYRMLWQARFLVQKRVSPRDVRALPPDLAAELPGESNITQIAFKAADLFSQARALSWEDLSFCLERLLLCDLANKGGATDETDTFSTDPVRNLQLLVLELTGATKS
ncbi:MAG TPA: DNA polymerase III subunit delta [Chthonomonadaceae bacterium]|nr:DNA polymerase III subunit delta [Chthonomonadaceae bacterium]